MAILSEANENANFADEIKWKCGCHNLSLDTAYNCVSDCDFVKSIDINSDSSVTSLCAGRWMSRPMTSARVEYSALSEVVMKDGSNRLLLRTGYDDEIQGTDISLRNVCLSTYDDRTCTGVDDIADKTDME
ncbi:hypothetical protein V8G54_014320 [Vigna mungo]|uniref:Uncharacterized protein n=1 Tax=Vigna mungo TaxID=3915 RepID=A0AAQ3NJ03_VIGMU